MIGAISLSCGSRPDCGVGGGSSGVRSFVRSASLAIA